MFLPAIIVLFVILVDTSSLFFGSTLHASQTLVDDITKNPDLMHEILIRTAFSSVVAGILFMICWRCSLLDKGTARQLRAFDNELKANGIGAEGMVTQFEPRPKRKWLQWPRTTSSQTSSSMMESFAEKTLIGSDSIYDSILVQNRLRTITGLTK
jgi:hypothetical protein